MKLKVPMVISSQPFHVKLIGGLALLAFVIIFLMAWRLRVAHAETARIQLEKANAEARATPSAALTQDQLAKFIRDIGETVAGATKPAVQAPQRNDALDKALASDRVAIAALVASIASLTAHATSTGAVVSTANDSVRAASFDVSQPPYTVHADVKLPRPPAHGTLDATVDLEPAHLSPRIGCGPAINGVRSAQYTITGPPWLTMVIDSSSQDPALCNPGLKGGRSAFHPTISVGPGVSLQYDPVLRRFRSGPSVNVSLNLWTCAIGLNLFRGKCS